MMKKNPNLVFILSLKEQLRPLIVATTAWCGKGQEDPGLKDQTQKDPDPKDHGPKDPQN